MTTIIVVLCRVSPQLLILLNTSICPAWDTIIRVSWPVLVLKAIIGLLLLIQITTDVRITCGSLEVLFKCIPFIVAEDIGYRLLSEPCNQLFEVFEVPLSRRYLGYLQLFKVGLEKFCTYTASRITINIKYKKAFL